MCEIPYKIPTYCNFVEMEFLCFALLCVMYVNKSIINFIFSEYWWNARCWGLCRWAGFTELITQLSHNAVMQTVFIKLYLYLHCFHFIFFFSYELSNLYEYKFKCINYWMLHLTTQSIWIFTCYNICCKYNLVNDVV